MGGVDITVPVRLTGDGGVFCVEISRSIHNEFWEYVDWVMKKHAGYVQLRIGPPARSISRGYRSQMARWWGHCSDIAEQLSLTLGKTYTKERVSEGLKVIAVRDHYPTVYNDITDVVEPQGMEDCTAEQYEILERVKQKFADDRTYWLREYAEGADGKLVPYKSVQGRTLAEMVEYWKGSGKAD